MLTSSTIRFTTDTFGDPLTFEDEEITPESYTITWKNYDGTVLEIDENAIVGTTPSYSGETPTKPEDNTYTYTFSKWTPDIVAVTSEATYTAKFTRTKKKYTVTWKNYDGTVLEIDENAIVGTTPSYSGATPTKPEDDTYTYTFLEWNPTPTQILANTTYTATFSRTEKAQPPTTYTVTWKNYDGAVLKTETVEEGTVPSYSGATPTKDETATDTALFDKWIPAPAPITADTVYIASFNITPKTFTVIWKNYDGTVLETDNNVEAGTTPTYDGATPTKDEDENYTYTFNGWGTTPLQIFEDATYTAVFSQAEKPQSSTPETFTKKALLTYKKPFDFTNKSAVDRFVITGNEPEGSRRRIIFKIDEQLYRFRNGALQAYTWGGELDDILVYGNRVSVLEALENVNAFVGKKVYPIIALKAPYDAADMPTIKLAVESRANADQLTDTIESPVYEITDGDAQVITSISYKPVCTGNGSVEVSTRLRDQTGWSEYMEITEAVGKEASAIQFKFTYIVTKTDGTDSAKVESVTVSYASGQAIVTGGTARLFSKVRDYEVDLQSCYVVVRHEPLVDSTITAYVNFMDAPKHRDFLRIGIGTGSRQELLLGTNSTPDKNIVASSIKIYQDSELVDDYDFSAELSTVVFSAKKNSVIFASYDYDYGPEKWLEMTPRLLQPYNDDNGTYVSRFFLNLNPTDAIGKRISNVQIRLKRLSGTATENLGVATGRTQLFTLEHNAVPSSINFSEDVDFSFDEESGILSCVATAGTLLNVSYNWQGKGTVVYSFAAGWVPNSGFEYQEGDYQHSLIGGGSGSDYELPTMSNLIKGGAKVGLGLAMTEDTLNVDLSTAISNDTISIDAEPRIYVAECTGSIEWQDGERHYPHSFEPYQMTSNEPSISGGVTLEGAPAFNQSYQLIDGVYYAVCNTAVADEAYFPYRGNENVTVKGLVWDDAIDGYAVKDLVAGRDFYVGYHEWAETNVISFSHEDLYNTAVSTATIWADGRNVSQEAQTSVANLVIGNGLSLTGDTLSADAMNAAIDAWEYKGTALLEIDNSDGNDQVIFMWRNSEYEELLGRLSAGADEGDANDTEKDFAFYEINAVAGGSTGDEYFLREYTFYNATRTCNPLAVHINKHWYLLERVEAVINWRRDLLERVAQLELRVRTLENRS